MKTFIKVLSIFKREERPIKYLIAKIFWKTRICLLITISMKGYKIKFFPTALSASLWINKEGRIADENFLSSYLKRDSVFIDIGANIGTHTLKAASIVKENGKVISVEPHPRTFHYLKENIHLNKFMNIDVFNFAVGNRSEYVTFSDMVSDDQNCIDSNGIINLETKRLDDFVSLESVDLIKIDVEGYELFVLLGAANVLAHTECVMFESFEKNFNKYGYSTYDTIKLLLNSGFTVFGLAGNTLKIIREDHKSMNCEILFAVRDIQSFVRRTGYSIS